jgi:O-acetyl-ADP-ribose deacetylase (regulator of RNase III)
MWWRSTKQSIKRSVISAVQIVNEQDFKSVAFPIIGAGTGGFGEESALLLMQEAICDVESSAEVFSVKFKRNQRRQSN